MAISSLPFVLYGLCTKNSLYIIMIGKKKFIMHFLCFNIQILIFINFHWVSPIRLPVVYGCFHSAVVMWLQERNTQDDPQSLWLLLLPFPKKKKKSFSTLLKEENKSLLYFSWKFLVPNVTFVWPKCNLAAAGVGSFCASSQCHTMGNFLFYLLFYLRAFFEVFRASSACMSLEQASQ